MPLRPALRLLPLLLLTGAARSPQAATLHYQLDGAHSQLSAQVAFFGLAHKSADFPSISGSLALPADRSGAIALDIQVDASKLTAGDRLTQERLRGPKFFDVAHYPMVRFRGTAIHMTGARTATIAGTLTVRGLSHIEVLNVTLDRDPYSRADNAPVTLTGTMTIDRRIYGMTAYSLVVGRKVDIAIRARMVPG